MQTQQNNFDFELGEFEQPQQDDKLEKQMLYLV